MKVHHIIIIKVIHLMRSYEESVEETHIIIIGGKFKDLEVIKLSTHPILNVKFVKVYEVSQSLP